MNPEDVERRRNRLSAGVSLGVFAVATAGVIVESIINHGVPTRPETILDAVFTFAGVRASKPIANHFVPQMPVSGDNLQS